MFPHEALSSLSCYLCIALLEVVELLIDANVCGVWPLKNNKRFQLIIVVLYYHLPIVVCTLQSKGNLSQFIVLQ